MYSSGWWYWINFLGLFWNIYLVVKILRGCYIHVCGKRPFSNSNQFLWLFPPLWGLAPMVTWLLLTRDSHLLPQTHFQKTGGVNEFRVWGGVRYSERWSFSKKSRRSKRVLSLRKAIKLTRGHFLWTDGKMDFLFLFILVLGCSQYLRLRSEKDLDWKGSGNKLFKWDDFECCGCTFEIIPQKELCPDHFHTAQGKDKLI